LVKDGVQLNRDEVYFLTFHGMPPDPQNVCQPIKGYFPLGDQRLFPKTDVNLAKYRSVHKTEFLDFRSAAKNCIKELLLSESSEQSERNPQPISKNLKRVPVL
jgi:hypothetical protein